MVPQRALINKYNFIQHKHYLQDQQEPKNQCDQKKNERKDFKQGFKKKGQTASGPQNPR
jgi:hypothetical protein